MNGTSAPSLLSANSMFRCLTHAGNPIDPFSGAALAIFAVAVLLIVFFCSYAALGRAKNIRHGRATLAAATALLGVIGLFHMATRPGTPATQTPSVRTSPEIEFPLLIYATTAASMVVVLILAMLMKGWHRILWVCKLLRRSSNEDRNAIAKDNRFRKAVDAHDKRRTRKHNPSGRLRRRSEVE